MIEITKQYAFIPVSDETLIDMGLEPSAGYWERALASNLRRYSLRGRLRWARYLYITRPISEARFRLGRALMGDRYPGERDD